MAKRKIVWTAQAKLDLTEILEFFIKRNGTKTYSIKLNSSIFNSIKLLLKYPEIGVQTDIENVRVLIKGDYGIFYEIRSDVILIISIWDNRQNHEKLVL